METSAAKRKANQGQNQHIKKQRVVLGEITNLTNMVIDPQTSCVKEAAVSESVEIVVDTLHTLEVTNLFKSISLQFE